MATLKFNRVHKNGWLSYKQQGIPGAVYVDKRMLEASSLENPPQSIDVEIPGLLAPGADVAAKLQEKADKKAAREAAAAEKANKAAEKAQEKLAKLKEKAEKAAAAAEAAKAKLAGAATAAPATEGDQPAQ